MVKIISRNGKQCTLVVNKIPAMVIFFPGNFPRFFSLARSTRNSFYLPSPMIPLAPLDNAKSLNFSTGSLQLAMALEALSFISASALAPEV